MTFHLGRERHKLEKVELPGGVVCMCRPCTTPVWEAAMAHARRTVAELVAGEEVMEDLGLDTELLPDLTDPDAQEGFRRLLFVQALARYAIKSWTGVVQPAGKDESGKDTWTPAPVSPAAIAEMMTIHRMAEEFIGRYAAKLLERYSEGNASRPSPNGTSAEGLNIAKGARRSRRPARRGARA